MRIFVLLLTIAACTSVPRHSEPVVATFSIVAFDPETKELGIAVQSKFFGVGSVVPWAKAGVGAVATQAWANVGYGPDGLALLAGKKTAAETLAALVGNDDGRDYRQVGIVDAQGNAASHTGAKCNAWAGHKTGKNFCVQGNILAGPGVVDAMAKAFETTKDKPLADRLVAALEAGQAAGGDKRGRQSAALYVVRDKGGFMGGNDRFIDIRVEDHKEPIKELARLLELHKQFFKRAHARR